MNLVINRCLYLRLPTTSVRTISLNGAMSQSNDDSDNKDNKSENKEAPKKNQEAINKLNELLKTMSTAESPFSSLKSDKKIDISKPRIYHRLRQNEFKENQAKEAEEAKENELGNQLEKAAHEVATSYGGDTSKTELELLDLLLSRKGKTEEGKVVVEKEDQKSEKVGGVPEKPAINLSELISGMKIDSSSPSDSNIPLEQTRAYQIKQILNRMKRPGEQDAPFYRRPTIDKRRTRMQKPVTVDIYGEEPLGIFDSEKKEDAKNEPVLATWERMKARDLKLRITHPPANIFEQMALWTEQGKLWKFPIDNEQDWKSEENVDFSEHVFLEPLIDSWCPEGGPVRHFMHLVCVGLSKNPYLSVREKRDHLKWYEDYFRNKNQLLEETGAGTIADAENDDEMARSTG